MINRTAYKYEADPYDLCRLNATVEPEWIQAIRRGLPSIPFACILGSSKADANTEDISKWKDIGRILVSNGIGIIHAGQQGIITAIRNIVMTDNGWSIGLLSSTDKKDCIKRDTEEIYIKNPLHRIEAFIRLGDFYIVLPGGIGTMVEILSVMWFMDRGFIKNKRIFFFGEQWDELTEFLSSDPLVFKDRPICNNFIRINNCSEMSKFFDGIT